MIQDAINALAQLLKQFKGAYSLEVFSDGSLILIYNENSDGDEDSKDFNNAQELIEWMEANLTKVK